MMLVAQHIAAHASRKEELFHQSVLGLCNIDAASMPRDHLCLDQHHRHRKAPHVLWPWVEMISLLQMRPAVEWGSIEPIV